MVLESNSNTVAHHDVITRINPSYTSEKLFVCSVSWKPNQALYKVIDQHIDDKNPYNTTLDLEVNPIWIIAYIIRLLFVK